MEQQYITHLAEAYQRGYEKKYAGVDNAPEDKDIRLFAYDFCCK